MNVLKAITERRSHRGTFQKRDIETDDLEKLIEAARWAPSPFNVQPWELVLIQEAAGKSALADLTEQAVIAQFKDAKFLDDNSRWMRLTETEWQALGGRCVARRPRHTPKVASGCPRKTVAGALEQREVVYAFGAFGCWEDTGSGDRCTGARGTAADAGYDELQEISAW